MFVISDLHIGDRSPKDNLCRANREVLLDGFLDYVEDQNGRLVIVGDFLELLRYPFDQILAQRRRLLDRLAAMEALYVPGNHDEAALSFVGDGRPPHPFFERMSRAFVQIIGDRGFKFMHGHEVDPLVGPGIQRFGRMIGTLGYLLEFRQGTCVLTDDVITDTFLEIGEQMLLLWGRLRHRMSKVFRGCYYRMPSEGMTLLTRQIRTQRMLERYGRDKSEGLYDIAIVGHTHKAGTFGDWYFNSGSWTGPNNNFLRISPGGDVAVFDWTGSGPRPNTTIIAA